MTTLNQACKAIIENGIDNDYLVECGEGSTLYSVFMEEKGNWAGFTVTSVKYWLQGLPSAVAFPFYNNEILSVLESNGITRKTEKGNDALIDSYWSCLAIQTYLIMQKQS